MTNEAAARSLSQQQLSTLHSSEHMDWETPRALFEMLDREFGFDLDPASTHGNALCERHYTIEDDGLAQPWAPARVFLNPPYGQQLKRWIVKAAQEAALGALVVALIPARTDTSWWHDWIEGKAEVRFLRGRVTFTRSGRRMGGMAAAPFPSCIVVFR